MIAIAREWYGSVERSPHTKLTSMGKIHILFLLGEIKVWGKQPHTYPKIIQGNNHFVIKLKSPFIQIMDMLN